MGDMTASVQQPSDWRGQAAAMIRIAVTCAVVAILLNIAFIAVLAITLQVTSDARITAQLKKGLDHGVLDRASYPPSPYGHVGHGYDMFTDCVAFGTNLNNTDKSILHRIAASPYVADGIAPPRGSCEMLTDALAKGSAKADLDYLRFWHGYQVYTRAILSITSIDNLRRLTAVLFYGVLLWLVHQLARTFGRWTWPIVLLPFFLVSDFLVTPIIVSHALPLICIFLSAILVSVLLERTPNSSMMMLPVLVFSTGAVTSFFSFLLNPPMAPALIAFLVIAAHSGRSSNETINSVFYGGTLAVLWLAGYVVTWMLKWLFAAAVLGPETVLNDLTSSVAKYDMLDMSQALGFLTATWRNLSVNGIFLFYMLGSIAAAIAAMMWVMRFRGGRRQDVWDFLAMLTPLLVIVVWAEANRSHSAWHTGYVSRSFVLFSVIPLLAAALVWRRTSSRLARTDVGNAAPVVGMMPAARTKSE